MTDDELAAVIARRAALAEPVPVALRALGYASAAAVAAIFERMGFAPATRLRPTALARALPPGMARALWVLPIGETPAGVVVAMADPTDAHALSELAYQLGKPVDPRSAPLDELRAALLEIDPPPEVTVSRTQPAPAPPPPRSDAPTAPALRRRTMTPGGARGPLRRPTPAYGEASPFVGTGRVPSWGRVDPPFAGMGRGRFAAPALAIGSYTPPSPVDRSGPDVEAPFPLQRKATTPATRHVVATSMPRDALYTLAELRMANDRDVIARIAVRGLTTVAQRAAFFVVKRGVVQGWEGATVEGAQGAGVSREALRNLWIPVTSPSVFRLASELGGLYVGPLSDSTADSILAAALGGRVRDVLLAPIQVRGHNVAFLYGDGLRSPREARERAAEIVEGAAEALERWLVALRQGR